MARALTEVERRALDAEAEIVGLQGKNIALTLALKICLDALRETAQSAVQPTEPS